MQPYPPLASLFAASYLKAKGYSIALFDPMLRESPQEILPALDHHQPRAVVFHEDNFNWLTKMCLTRMRDACFEMIKHVRRRLGQSVTVIVAGSDATDRKDLYLKNGADYVIVGESEVTLHELISNLLSDGAQAVGEIPGLAFAGDGNIVSSPPRGYLKNLDAVPLPDWDLVDMDSYRDSWNKAHGYFSLNMVTTRGCPFRCNWCAKPVYGDRYNSRSPENVVEELLLLKTRYEPDHIWFADDIFGLKPGWVESFGELVEQAGAAIPFKMQGRVDLLHEDAVIGLKKAGCKTVWVGAESGSQKILDAMDKGTTVGQIYDTAARLKRYGIEVCFFLQFGYPGETEEDIDKTLKMVRDCEPDDIGISVSYPLPGTRFFERVKDEMKQKQNWEHSNDLAMMFAGAYQPDFYRQLHKVVHYDFRFHKSLATLAGICRHPSNISLNGLKNAAMSIIRWPVWQLERARLNRLKSPNLHIS